MGEFGAALAKDLRIYLRYPAWVIGDLLSTPLWFLFFVLAVFVFTPPDALTPDRIGLTLSYFFWGYVFVTLFNTNLAGVGHVMLSEQLAGTLEQVVMAPINRFTLVAGRWVRTMIIDLLVIFATAAFLTAAEGTGISLADPPLLLGVLALFELGMLGAGLILAAVTMRYRNFFSFVNYAWFGVVIFSGVFFPVSSLPAPLSAVSLLIPTTYYVDLIKYAAVAAPPIFGLLPELALLGAMSAALLLVGWYLFGWVERLAKVRGQLSSY